MGYKFLEHTADIKIAVEEKDLESAFRSSALAMKEVIAEKIKIKPEKSRIISLEEKDLKDLFYRFLEEFLFLLDAEDFILSSIEDLEIIEDKNNKVYGLSSKILGDKASSYKFSNDVKAITFNDMKIEIDKKTGKTFIQFVLDV